MAGNNNATTIGAIVLIGGVGYLIYKHMHISSGTRPTLAPFKIKVNGVHLENDGSITMDLLIQNPNSIPLRIKSVIADLMVGKNKVANFNMFGDTIVNGNTQATVPVIAQLLPAARMMSSKIAPGHTRIEGQININDLPTKLSLAW